MITPRNNKQFQRELLHVFLTFKCYNLQGKIIGFVFIAINILSAALACYDDRLLRENFLCNIQSDNSMEMNETYCYLKYKETHKFHLTSWGFYLWNVLVFWVLAVAYSFLVYDRVVLFSTEVLSLIDMKPRLDPGIRREMTWDDLCIQDLAANAQPKTSSVSAEQADEKRTEHGEQLSKRSRRRSARGERFSVFRIYFVHLLLRSIALFVMSFFFNRTYFPATFSCSLPSDDATLDHANSSPRNRLIDCTNIAGKRHEIVAGFNFGTNLFVSVLSVLEIIRLVQRVLEDANFSMDMEFCSVYLLGKRKPLKQIFNSGKGANRPFYSTALLPSREVLFI